jgi:hypothetical protein
MIGGAAARLRSVLAQPDGGRFGPGRGGPSASVGSSCIAGHVDRPGVPLVVFAGRKESNTSKTAIHRLTRAGTRPPRPRRRDRRPGHLQRPIHETGTQSYRLRTARPGRRSPGVGAGAVLRRPRLRLGRSGDEAPLREAGIEPQPASQFIVRRAGAGVTSGAGAGLGRRRARPRSRWSSATSASPRGRVEA